MKQENKSLLLTLEYPPIIGGVSRYYQNLVTYLGAEQIEVISEGLLGKRWPKWWAAIKKVATILKHKRYNYLLIGQVLPLGYVGLLAKLFFHQKYIVFAHGLDIRQPQNSWWKKNWLIIILKKSDKIIANSLFTKKELLKLGLAESKIEVIYPCINFKKELEPKIFNDKKIILSVGRLVERKGFDLVLKSLPEILKSFPEVQYIVIGGGPDEAHLKKIVQDLNLTKQVTFLGSVNEEDKNQWYRQANVFVMPCREIKQDVEGLGTVFLEAASYGLPIIVGNSGGASEAVINNQTGWLVDPTSSENLTTIIKRIFSDPKQAQEMGQQGKKMVEEKFVCSVQLAKFKKIIES